MSDKRITVCIATIRQDTPALLLWSLINQTFTSYDVCLIDDISTRDFDQKNWTKDPLYSKLLSELQLQGHRIKIIPGPKNGKVGAVYNTGWHATRGDWKNPLFFRAEDDTTLAPDAFQKLVALFDDPVMGAASGLVLTPGIKTETIKEDDPRYIHGTIDHIKDDFNLQWVRHERKKPFQVEHLHSTHMTSEAALERVGGYEGEALYMHREETFYTWKVHLEGMKVMVHPQVEIYHFKAGGGSRGAGVSSHSLEDLRRFNVMRPTFKAGECVKMTHAIGDLIMAEPSIRKLREKYPDRDLSVWHPYGEHVFVGNPDVDAVCKNEWENNRTRKYEKSVYSHMAEKKWEGHIINAYCDILGVPEDTELHPRLYDIEPMPYDRPYIVMGMQSNAKLFDFSGISRAKYWDVDKWQQVIDYFKDDYEMVHLTGEEVHDEYDNVLRIRNLPFRESWRWIAGAKLLISIDTMHVHVARALDVPMVVMWGRTQRVRYGYEGENIINFEKGCPGSRECYGNVEYQMDKTQCVFDNHPCMDYQPAEIIDAANQLLGRS